MRLLRGGRMTKWKGEAASYAPNLAHLVTCVSRPALLAVALAAGLAGPAPAQTLYWDGGTVNGGNAAVNANGGSGTWNNTLTNWDTAATGGVNSAWIGGAGAVFGGSAGGTVTVDAGGVAVNTIFFGRSGYVVDGGTITMTGASPNIGVSFLDSAVIDSVIAGTNGLTVGGGSGILLLNGTNTFTGGLTVAGTLRLGGVDSANGVNNVVRVLGGQQLQVATSTAFGNDTDASRLVLENGSILSLLSNLEHDVTINGDARITGNGTWTGVVEGTGPTTVRFQGSTLTVAGDLFDNGGVLSIDTATHGGAVTFTGNLAHTGGLTVGNATTLAGIKSYSGATIVAGHSSGTSMLTYSDAAAISANSNVVIGDASTVGLVQFGYTPANITLGTGGGQFRFAGNGGFLSRAVGALDVAVTLNGGAGLTWGAGNFIGDGNTLYVGADRFTGAARELDLTNDIDLGSQQRTVFGHQGSIADHGVLSGTLSGIGGGLQVVGDGLLELRGGNTYTGATEVQSTLMLGSAGALLGGIGVAGGQTNLQLNGVSGNYLNDGIVVLTAAGGDFSRGTGTGGDQVQWLADGGFTAVGGARTVNIGNGAALTWGQGGFVGDGRRLVFGGSYGNSAISFQNAVNLGSASRTIEVNNIAGNVLGLNLNGVISGSGALVLDGSGDVALTAANTFTGNTVLGSAGASDLEVTVTSIGAAGAPGNLGAGSAIELRSANGFLNYVGAGESTNRNWIVGLANGQHFFLNSAGTGALQLTGNVTSEPTSPNSALHLRGTFISTDGNSDGIADAPNLVSGVISDGPGTTLHIVVDGSAGSVWRLTGANTYSGVTTVSASRILEVDDLANGGLASSIGDSPNAATNLVLDGTLRYIGTGDSTDRLMQVSGSTRIESLGTGALRFTNPGLVARAFNTGNYNMTLAGTNTGDNIFAPTLTNLAPGLDHASIRLNVTKDGPGLWALTSNNNGQAHAYTGNTIITGGALRLDHAGAITGGLDTLSNHGAAGSTQRSSLVLFNGTAATAGVLGLTAASGPFTRGLTTEADAFLTDGTTPNAEDDDTYVQGVRWTGSGGFAAWGGTQTVNIGGSATPATLSWATGGFVPAGQSLVFGYETANGTVDFRNGVNLTSAARTIDVRNGTAAVDAIMSGELSSTTAGGALVKAGAGTLALTATNTYDGTTTINAGTLQIGNGGGTGTLGDGAVTLALAATIAFDRNNTYNVTNQFNGFGALVQKGSGTTTIASVFNVVGTTTISAGTLQINGTLSTATITMTGTSALTVNGSMGATAGGIATLIGDAGASTITVASGGTLRAIGDLGGGSDVFSLTGTLNSGAGTLDLGDGNDTFVLNANGSFTSVSGGAGTDTLTVNNSAARTLNATSATSFETLNKTLAGTLTLTGNHSYSAGVTIAGGVVQVGNGGTPGTLTTPTVANGGTLAFNLDGNYSFAGAISGTGAVTKLGTGVTTLTGTNSYGGLTNVDAGTLLINGNQTGAAGMTNVASGATLGGTGTIGGSVTVAGGATLTAGGVGSDPETLAIRGNLTLQPGAIVSIDLGEADTVGGPLNDLITVGGHLTLDGTLNITEPAGGDFGPGVYRLFNYGGTLTNNGLDTGSPERFVQTSIGGEVNLINAAGLQLTFWDGGAGPKFDGAVNGGSGTWLASGDQNWTGADGVFNAPFDNGEFAIFQGVPGTVTVSNANGQVETAGMNFAVTGYEIDGQPLTLVGSSAIIKVGVGSSAGSGMVATIRSVLQGTAQLVKTDMGTLVLTNNNTYSGSTAVNGGTLQIGGDGNLGDLGGALSLDGGRLRTTDTFTSNRLVTLGSGGGTFETASTTTLTLSNTADGAGALTKTGAGTLVLGGTNIYAGGTFLNGGTLQVAADANLGDAGGGLTFNGGRLRSTASFTSDRLVTLNSDGGTFDTDDLTTLTLTNAVGGTGRLRKDGDGTLVVAGVGSYSGGTTILAGTLQLGDGNASGSIIGNVTNNGTLAFDRTDAYTFAGVISGTGAVEQRGGGRTVLTAANSYTGATNVLAGELYINGNQAAAVGDTTVINDARVGGIGTIGGDVHVVDGGLNPGSVGIAPGTLTIRGSLTLTVDAELNYNFGQANVPGGPYNDLTIVNGNLLLDGIVNVTETAGGNFGPGIYRIISYGGALANLGLTDNSPDYSVQTSIANQVNLVNTTGVTLNFWDGPGGASGDLDIRGGDGDWRLADNDDWTDETGFFNGNYLDGSFAVFAGEAGTVNVDNTNGQVQAAGMQFAVDGYRLVGGPLVLTGPSSTIRVGDGSAPGIEYTATIDAVLDGDAELVKTDRGTLVLTGNNTYRGGTVFRGGTVEISSDSNLGDAAGGLTFDGGLLHTTASFEIARSFALVTQGGLMVEGGTTLTLAGKISGNGTLAKLGKGAIVYNSDSSDFTGTTLVEDGLLTVNGSLCGDINVLAGGRLQGTGTVCDTTNAGTVAPGNSIGTLTVAGNYTGTGGTLEMETVLGGDGSPTDRLVITGNTSGTTNVRIINLGGSGAQTQEGIRIIQVGGASNGTFTLLGDYVFQGQQAIVAGAYAYRLYKNGVSTPSDGDWYLRSAYIYSSPDEPLYAPGVPIYETYGNVLLEFSDLGTMHERLGNRSWQQEQGSSAGDRRTGLWARMRGFGGSFEPETSTSSAGYDLTMWKFEAGADMQFAETAAGAFLGGIVLHYGTLSADITSVFGSGEIGGNGYGIGATLTWLGDDGFYVDTQAQMSWFDSDLTSTTAGRSLITGNDGVGYAVSVEAGKRFVLGEWALTPQAQLGWASVDFDDFTDAFGAGVSLREGNALRGRIGVTLEREGNWVDAGGRANRWRIFGIANLYNDFGDGSTVEVAGTPLFSKNDSFWGGIGLGGSLSLADDKYAVYGQALAKTSLENFGQSNVVSGTVGFRIRW